MKHIWLLLLLGSYVYSGTTSGVLKKDETWEGVIEITGDVTVPEGITLRIKPNALIKFSANRDDEAGGYDETKSELIIEGILRAEGFEKFQIRFTSSNFVGAGEKGGSSQPQASDWYGLVFKEGGDRSILSYCVIEFAYDGVTCAHASPRVFRNRIEGNFWNGVLCDVLSSPRLVSNQILNNGYAGINAKIGSSPLVSANEITGNRYGILVQDVSKPILGDVRLGENNGKNAIYSNLEYNLFNHTKNVLYAQRNDWGDNSNADGLIHDDDEDKKFGIVVYTPVYSTGNISYLEFKSIASDVGSGEVEREVKKKEIEELKKQLADRTKPVSVKAGSTASAVSSKSQKQIEEEDKREKERLALLEDQLKQQEQIKLEQEKKLALQKQVEEEQAKKSVAVKKEAKVVAAFVPTKMANELDNNPKAINKVNPIMPDLARKAKLNGTVSLRVLVGTDGRAEEVYVSKKIGNKDFDQSVSDAAMLAVRQWVFEQGLSNLQPVKYWTVVTILMK